MSATAIYLFYKIHKYYMWHKYSANYLDYTSHEEQERIAKAHKRDFGFNRRYKPTLEISKKWEMYNELGGNLYYNLFGYHIIYFLLFLINC